MGRQMNASDDESAENQRVPDQFERKGQGFRNA